MSLSKKDLDDATKAGGPMLRSAMLAASETATAWTAGEQRLVGSCRTPVDDQSRKKQSVLVLENLSKLCTGHWPVIGSNTTVMGAALDRRAGGRAAGELAADRRGGSVRSPGRGVEGAADGVGRADGTGQIGVGHAVGRVRADWGCMGAGARDLNTGSGGLGAREAGGCTVVAGSARQNKK